MSNLSTTDKLRVGVIGAGFIAERGHLPGYQCHPQTEVVAICDPNEERAHKVAQEYGIRHVFADHRRMLETEHLDLVSVCTPNALHAPATIAALEAGAHVLCEKPMALTVAEAKTMIETAERVGRKLTVGFHNRFRPECQILKNLAEQGTLGEIYYARVSMLRRSGIPGYGSWFTNKKLAGGGSLMDSGVHGLDLVLWLMEQPRPVSVLGVTFREFGSRGQGLGGWGADIYGGLQQFDVDDLAVAMIRFENGAVLMLEISWAGHSISCEWLQLLGKDGGAELDLDPSEGGTCLRVFTSLHDQPVDIIPEVPKIALDSQFLASHPALSAFPNMKFLGAHQKKIEDTVDSIVHNRAPLVTPQQALLVTQLLESIYKSAETGREIRFKEGASYAET